jgi:hypothetical protein
VGETPGDQLGKVAAEISAMRRLFGGTSLLALFHNSSPLR